ncbi:MAG: glutamine--fructose-6-phosphate transaminase (isomerizing) [Patescibacteria group bacterium]
MCGIFGYVGHKTNASQIVLDGLKLLEYRGYDSWGIAYKIKNQKSKIKNRFEVEKHVGKIGDAKLKSQEDSSLAVGHTRWATHGGVTKKNAHPHLDCTGTISVVHNGIVENFEELKKDLIKKGHKFISETDTETIPHLIEEFFKKKGFTSAVRDAFNKLKGLNAIVVANANSLEIIAAKNGSPLVIGITKNGFLISSDVSGLSSHTNKIIFLEDDQMVVLNKQITVLSLPTGRIVEKKVEKINFEISHASRSGFDHFMIKEISEQPDIIRNIARNYDKQIESFSKMVENARGTFFIGAGTAYYAALAGVYLFSRAVHKHVNTSVASEFNYLEHFLTKDSLVIALSQSGETIDVIEPLNRARERGSKIGAITNSQGSSIYRMSDFNILLNAGVETAVASTKAYTAKLSVLLLLVFSMTSKLSEGKQILEKTADEAGRLLDKKNVDMIKKLAVKLKGSKGIYAIGRGVSFSSALETALKIKEVSYISSEGLAGGELKHGPIALIENGTPCVVFAPNDETYDSIISNAMEVKSRGGFTIGVSHKNSNAFEYWIKVEDLKDGSFIAQIVPIQLLAYFLALERKLDPDKPRNLAKSVTVK